MGRFGGKFFYMDEGSGDEEPRRNRDRISDITSVSETVHVLFHTDESVTRRGWRLEWSKYIFCCLHQSYFKGLLHLHHQKESWQQLVCSPLSTSRKDIPAASTKFRRSRFLRATPSGFVFLTLSVNGTLIMSQSPTKMAEDLDYLTEGWTLRTTGRRKLSATQTWLKFVSTLIPVVLTRVGGLTGVRPKSQLLF